jgi:fumarylacetoacetate (FAA) hydrolase
MKLASLKNNSVDGRLVVVSRDLGRSVPADDIAPSLRVALEQWPAVLPFLQARAQLLEAGKADNAFPFDAAAVTAPLPRAPQWLDGSAFPSHGERMVHAFNLSNVSLEVDRPLMYQGASDAFLGAEEPMPLPSEEHGIDIEGELGAITDAVPMGIGSARALEHVRLLVMLNDVSLRRLLFGEVTLGFGFIQAKPTCVFSPVAITPDELGGAWKDGRVHLRMEVSINGKRLGNLATDPMKYSFAELIAHAARTRVLSAGTIIGSGTVSNEDVSAGTSCLAERRALEMLEHGSAITDWLHYHDRVRIEVFDAENRTVFGAIDHTFVPCSMAEATV